MKIQGKYLDEIEKLVNEKTLNFDLLKNKSILITGATGMICSFLVDVLMYRNSKYNDNIKIYIISRTKEKVLKRFNHYEIEEYSKNNKSNLIYIIQNICKPLEVDIPFDYIIHGASNTHPVSYSKDPVGTITTNVLGFYNLLEYSISHTPNRIFLMSTVEIYGENKKDVEEFDENYLGYINCNTVRAGYPESKRVCESLAQAYISKYNMDIVIGRFPRTYGPTMQLEDSKASAQFIKNALNNEDIVLKSEGNQYYSYCYTFDAVSALLKILLDGISGEAYNIADKKSNITLKEFANILANFNNKEVVFELPNDIEKKGFSNATKAIMNADKLKKLGWTMQYDIKNGLIRTLEIMRENSEI